jgi:ribonuclease III
MDMVFCRAGRSHRGRLLTGLQKTGSQRTGTPHWLADTLGTAPADTALYEQALTHASSKAANYERLEFLGDRVLGLLIAEWLFEKHPTDPEGRLSHRLNELVSRVTCAAVGRTIGLAPHLRLGKQALDDGAYESDNVLGDVVEALIGALYRDHGLDAARTFVRRHWAAMLDGQKAAPRHPKSSLQEWAAAQNRKPPHYELVERSGPDHAPVFIVRVSVGSAGDAVGEGKSKQEAERAAAAALLERVEV